MEVQTLIQDNEDLQKRSFRDHSSAFYLCLATISSGALRMSSSVVATSACFNQQLKPAYTLGAFRSCQKL
jgi:hypothetical protein